MDLQVLANLADIFGAVLVIGGLIFAFVQVAQFRRQRRDAAAIELARSFQSADFVKALGIVLNLPDNVDCASFKSLKPECEPAALLVSLTLEAVGIMVHRRVIGLDMVWELMGGVVLVTWQKLQMWTREMRVQQKREKFNEWMEWLADQLQQYVGAQGEEPAFRRYRHWRSRSSWSPIAGE